MTEVFITYIERKIAEETAKRDAIRSQMPDILSPDYNEEIRKWWAYEGRIQAYEDSLIQYKLTRQ